MATFEYLVKHLFKTALLFSEWESISESENKIVIQSNDLGVSQTLEIVPEITNKLKEKYQTENIVYIERKIENNGEISSIYYTHEGLIYCILYEINLNQLFEAIYEVNKKDGMHQQMMLAKGNHSFIEKTLELKKELLIHLKQSKKYRLLFETGIIKG
jgi:hypothetical protein